MDEVSPTPAPAPTPNAPLSDVQVGQPLAYLSYASSFLGLPLFLIPMLQKDNHFAMYHARQAAGIFVMWIVLFAIVMAFSIITCGIGAFAFPILFIAYVPTIHGLMIVSKGECTEPALLFGLGDKLFGGFKADKAPPLP